MRHVYNLLRRKKKKLSRETQQQISKTLCSLQDAILRKDKESAADLAKQAESLSQLFFKKSALEHAFDLIFALAFALAVAILIRQVWFEFYEIPSGSMRPTLKEQDRLVVSKTDFGVNFPLQPKHFYFDPSLVNRSGIIVFTWRKIWIFATSTPYIFIFSLGKKQYIKRLIGRPGDILYFYEASSTESMSLETIYPQSIPLPLHPSSNTSPSSISTEKTRDPPPLRQMDITHL